MAWGLWAQTHNDGRGSVLDIYGMLILKDEHAIDVLKSGNTGHLWHDFHAIGVHATDVGHPNNDEDEDEDEKDENNDEDEDDMQNVLSNDKNIDKVANLLRLFRIPQISPASTAKALSDKTKLVNEEKQLKFYHFSGQK